jgi:uncharacterized protein
MGSLLAAFGLMLVLEGVVPFASPGAWRETFRRIMELNDSQIRYIGLGSMVAGLILLRFSA